MSNDTDYIFGIRPVIEAINAGKSFDRLIVKRGLKGSLYHEMIALVRESGILYQAVPPERLNQVTRKNHQGVIGWLSAIEYQDIENLLPSIYESGADPLILILNGITDVRNFGAIARSAECMSVHCIVIPEKGSARINADAVKTSSGALHNIPVSRVKSLTKAIDFLKNSGVKIIAASEKPDQSIRDTDLTGPSALIMGAEERGISSEIADLADEHVTIPITGVTSSLNVSVATGIVR
ncbi:MAG: 23S rRNA (guanosine(2251)-2'-O)-methyltransferase RlmB [Bacteroidales bacterium]|nr:23S rRNA (guanosine(2251)-2'-O)-methyltransferase RlmB [Bacteroidales bacterium]